VIAGLTVPRHNRNNREKIVDKINCGYYQKMMKRTIGYMITWTTYGSWLQGEKKGYVKNGKILAQNDKLKSANQRQQKNLRSNLIQNKNKLSKIQLSKKPRE